MVITRTNFDIKVLFEKKDYFNGNLINLFELLKNVHLKDYKDKTDHLIIARKPEYEQMLKEAFNHGMFTSQEMDFTEEPDEVLIEDFLKYYKGFLKLKIRHLEPSVIA